MALQSNINYKIKIYEIDTNIETLNGVLSDKQIEEVYLLKNNSIKNFIIEKCYCKIDNLKGNKENISFKLFIYNSTKNKLINIVSYNFKPNVSNDSDNFIKQAYIYLKTLPEFANAIDLLDEGQVI